VNRSRGLLVSIAALLVWQVGWNALAEEQSLAMARPLRLARVTADPPSAPVHARITLTIELEATYDNPFDADDVRLDATVSPPEGPAWQVPGFLCQPFTRELVEDRERLAPGGAPQWLVRLSFPRPGVYSVVVSATDRSGTVTAPALTLEATPADVPGMVRRHATDHRYFVTDRGETLFLSGANVCWGGGAGTYDYDTWLPKYAEAGCNWFRVWLSPQFFTFAMNTNESGFDRISLGNAWRLDHVLGLAERLGLRVMVCIDSFNILRSEKRLYGAWEKSPYTTANGGPLEEPREYFTNAVMLNAYQDRLRYLVARYGCGPGVFAWEFWNEVDIIDQYDSATVTGWHRDMARYLRSIDPWRHLIGTSHARPSGDPRLDALPEVDYVQTHHYGVRDMAKDLHEDRLLKAAALDRPHFHGEYGISGNGVDTSAVDPDGVHLHNGLYASVGQLQAGTPMTWWWDSYVEPRNLYPVFAAFNKWVAGFDFVAQAARSVKATLLFPEERPQRVPDDDVLSPSQVSWKSAPFNAPVSVQVSREGDVVSPVPLSRVMHGVRNHPDLHNPVSFQVDAPHDSTFGVVVEGVSGHGGAALQIRIDDTVVRDEAFDDPDGTDNKDTLTKYDGVYDAPIPAGRHTITVENTGTDWFNVSYRIPWLRGEPMLRVLGVQGTTEGLVWVQNRAHTWPAVAKGKHQAAPVNGACLRLESMPPGTWRVETWDTVKGDVTCASTQTVGADGLLEFPLPPITWDAAFRLRLESR
jgi:hypothetical protein